MSKPRSNRKRHWPAALLGPPWWYQAGPFCSFRTALIPGGTDLVSSIRLTPGDCGSHLRTVNSLSWSSNQFRMIWALWHGALLEAIRRLVHCCREGMDMVNNNTQLGCAVQLVLRGPTCHSRNKDPSNQAKFFNLLLCQFPDDVTKWGLISF